MKSPGEDYDVYLDFIKSWAEYSSDGESNIQIRVPKNYLPFSKNLATYGLTHMNNFDNPENNSIIDIISLYKTLYIVLSIIYLIIYLNL